MYEETPNELGALKREEMRTIFDYIRKIDEKLIGILYKQEEIEKHQKEGEKCVSSLVQEITLMLQEEGNALPGERVLAKALPNQAFETLSQFLAFDHKLRDEDFFIKIVQELAGFAYGTPEEFIRESWRRLMADHVAEMFFWSEVSDKLAARYLTSAHAIRFAFEKAFPEQNNRLVDDVSQRYFQRFSESRL